MAKKIPTGFPRDLFGVMLNGEWLTESAARQFQTEPEPGAEVWFIDDSFEPDAAMQPETAPSNDKTRRRRGKQRN